MDTYTDTQVARRSTGWMLHIFTHDYQDGKYSLCGSMEWRPTGAFDGGTSVPVGLVEAQEKSQTACQECQREWSRRSPGRPSPFQPVPPPLSFLASDLNRLAETEGHVVYTTSSLERGQWFQGPYTVVLGLQGWESDCTCTPYFYTKVRYQDNGTPKSDCRHLKAALERYTHDEKNQGVPSF